MIPNDGQKAFDAFADVREAFRDPPMIYAPYQFWFWDQDLRTLGIKPQDMARELYEKGFNPGYAHARTNYAQEIGGGGDHVWPLPVEDWLSPAWFDEFGKAVRQADRDGSHLSFTDEYGWPSLQAGGRILAAHPDMAATSLDFAIRDIPPGGAASLPSALFTVAARLTGTRAASYVAFEGTDWVRIRTFADGSAPWEAATLPYNMGAVHAPAGHRALFHPHIARGGTHTLYGRWVDVGGNGEVTYRVRSGARSWEVRADQRCDADRWNPLGRFDLDAGDDCTIALASAGAERLCVDAIMLIHEDAPHDPIVIDERNTMPRSIGTLDGDSLAVIGAPDAAFDWTAPTDATYRVYSFSRIAVPGYDGSPIDYLDPRLGRMFTALAYEPYRERMGRWMGRGKPMNGAFSDHEGSYGYKMAWSDSLPGAYEAATGRDIRRDLPLLIDEDVQGRDANVRFDWYDVVTDLYSENFTAPIRYAERLGMYYTLHTWEESLQLQAATVGDYFKLTRKLTLPGTDCLKRVAYNPANFAETTSIAEFEGRRAMTEMMALSPLSDYRPVELKKQANFLGAYGIGHVVTHAVKMTRQLAQDVVTPDFYDIDPAWQYMRAWTDYVRRISYINSSGYREARVLLLNPMDSIWALSQGDVMDQRYDTTAIEGSLPANNAAFGGKASEMNRIYTELIRSLTLHRIDHMIADKTYVRQMDVRNGALVRGRHAFETVILPPMGIIDRDVAEKLLAFVASGGYVYHLGALPSGSIQVGRNDDRIREIFARLCAHPHMRYLPDPAVALGQGLPGLQPQVVVLEGPSHLLAQRRVLDGRVFYWIAHDDDGERTCRLLLPGKRGRVTLWDAEDGCVRPACAQQRADGMEVSLRLAAYGGIYIVLDPQEMPTEAPSQTAYRVALTIEDGWTVHMDPGCRMPVRVHDIPMVTTDRIRLVLRRGPLEAPDIARIRGMTINDDPQIAARAAVSASSGAHPERAADCDPDTQWQNDAPLIYGEPQWLELHWPTPISLRRIAIATDPECPIGSYRVECQEGDGWRNLVSFAGSVQPPLMRLIAYPPALLGEGVPVALSDWKGWGVLPERFAGLLDYEVDVSMPRSIGRVRLDLGRVEQTAEVWINDVHAGARLFPPFRFDVTEAMREGVNRIRVRVGNAIACNEGGYDGESGLLGPVTISRCDMGSSAGM